LASVLTAVLVAKGRSEEDPSTQRQIERSLKPSEKEKRIRQTSTAGCRSIRSVARKSFTALRHKAAILETRLVDIRSKKEPSGKGKKTLGSNFSKADVQFYQVRQEKRKKKKSMKGAAPTRTSPGTMLS